MIWARWAGVMGVPMKWEIARIFVVGTGGSGFCAEAAPSGVIGFFMAVAPYSSFFCMGETARRRPRGAEAGSGEAECWIVHEKYRPFTSSAMTAKLALDVSIGSDFQENPVEGTLTSASSWHSARA